MSHPGAGPESDGESKEARILRSALSEFCRKGFHRATMEDIAAGAGVGKGTLYLYFRSKQALLEEIFRLGLEGYTAGIRAVAGGSEPARTRLGKIAAFALEYAAANREFARLAQEGPVGMREEFKRWLLDLQGRILETVRQVAQEGVEAGQFRKVDPELVANLFMGGIHSAVTALVWGEGRRDPREVADALTDIVVEGAGRRD